MLPRHSELHLSAVEEYYLMGYEYLMNVSSGLFLVCYIPELYANYKNKNANIWNIPEKVLVLLGTTLAFSYSILNQDQSLMINYGPILFLDIVALSMRSYYVYRNTSHVILEEESSPTSF